MKAILAGAGFESVSTIDAIGAGVEGLSVGQRMFARGVDLALDPVAGGDGKSDLPFTLAARADAALRLVDRQGHSRGR